MREALPDRVRAGEIRPSITAISWSAVEKRESVWLQAQPVASPRRPQVRQWIRRSGVADEPAAQHSALGALGARWNGGATWIPHALDERRESATTTAVNLGQSIVWRGRDRG